MDKTIKRLSEILGRNLLALYQYEVLTQKSLVIVVKKADFFRLEKIKPVLQGINFVILSENDLQEGTDVFPLEFLRFKNNTERLKGKDVFKELKILKKHLRPHLEYELRSKRMYLRMEYLGHKKSKTFLPYIMPTFAGFIDALLYLKSVRNLESLTIEEKLETLGKKYEIDVSVLFQLVALQDKSIRRQLVDREIPAIIQSVDTILYELIEKINNL